jgi:hypothetical protein
VDGLILLRLTAEDDGEGDGEAGVIADWGTLLGPPWPWDGGDGEDDGCSGLFDLVVDNEEGINAASEVERGRADAIGFVARGWLGFTAPAAGFTTIVGVSKLGVGFCSPLSAPEAEGRLPLLSPKSELTAGKEEGVLADSLTPSSDKLDSEVALGVDCERVKILLRRKPFGLSGP